MAGLEVVVRPVVFPNIRPAPRPSVLPAETDPTKGLAVIRGQSARTIELPYSNSTTWSVSVAPKETKRVVDVARIYQKGGGGGTTRSAKDGGVNRDNFIDVEVVRNVTMLQKDGEMDYDYAPIKQSENIEIIQTGLVKRR